MQRDTNPLAPADTQPLTILRPRNAARHVAISISSLYRWEADPDMGFPKRIRLSANSSGWLRHELDSWLAARVLERDRALKAVAA